MGRYYLRLLTEVPALLFGSAERLLTFATLTVAFIGFFNRELARRALGTWEGFPPWVGILPILALVAYGLLKVNYEQVETLRPRARLFDLRRDLSDFAQDLMIIRNALLFQPEITEEEVKEQRDELSKLLPEITEYARDRVPELLAYMSKFDFRIKKEYEGPASRNRMIAYCEHTYEAIEQILEKLSAAAFVGHP
jgi:hypothetical protein